MLSTSSEGGARIQTIMAVLGHRSPAMSLIYASLSDPTVKQQYQDALDQHLGPEVTMAGPAAQALREHRLDPDAVHWLQSNFLKTELELGHCLRLPQEGPCECDLVLSCSKFVTTTDYAPRLRARLTVERQLINDATTRGWAREIERHQATHARLEQLLRELGELEVSRAAATVVAVDRVDYVDTFIAVADDSTAITGTAPPSKPDNPSVATRMFAMISQHPYRYTSGDVVFTVFADRRGIPEQERAAARDEFYSRSQACLRSSDLGKRYGWGVHADAEGRIALIGVETPDYAKFVSGQCPGTGGAPVTLTKAMRSSRAPRRPA